MKNSRKKKISFNQGCILVVIIYFLLAGLLYFAAGTQLYERISRNELISVQGDYALGEFAAGYKVRQTFRCDMDTMEDFQIYIAAFQRANRGHIVVRLKDDQTGRKLYERVIDAEQTEEGQVITNVFPKRLEGLRGHMLSIELTSEDGVSGSAAGIWYHSKIQNDNQQLYINGKAVSGTLCFDTHGTDWIWTGPNYWKIVITAGILLLLFCIYLIRQHHLGKKNIVITSVYILQKYKFLLKQLVSRDFKNKYKRSVLGALWSFVNPLLLMSVQYFVFSAIFKSNIENYPVYLLSGTVMFNFFTESTNVSMYAVTGNAGLIKKVYVPKYIYPVSKVLSTGINLLISLVPLLIMSIATGLEMTKAWLLIPFDLLFLLVFCIGMGFLLSAVMVFFRDIQFIWSVFSMVLTYATPIFYPESILPDRFRWVLNINPMYHMIRFFREIVLEGISPEPREYLVCALFSVISLVIGLAVFRKTQDKFIFYI